MSGNPSRGYRSGLTAVASYFIFWMGYFIIFRGIFLLYNHQLSWPLELPLISGVFYHGLKMDVSFSSYLTLLILAVLSLSIFFRTKTTVRIINVISTIFLILISIISVVDLELFQEWGFRFDATPLMYLNTPKGNDCLSGFKSLFYFDLWHGCGVLIELLVVSKTGIATI